MDAPTRRRRKRTCEESPHKSGAREPRLQSSQGSGVEPLREMFVSVRAHCVWGDDDAPLTVSVASTESERGVSETKCAASQDVSMPQPFFSQAGTIASQDSERLSTSSARSLALHLVHLSTLPSLDHVHHDPVRFFPLGLTTLAPEFCPDRRPVKCCSWKLLEKCC